MAEKAPDLTPFRYAFNNPINVIDPDGNFEQDDFRGSLQVYGGQGGERFSFSVSGAIGKNSGDIRVARYADGSVNVISETEYSKFVGDGVKIENFQQFRTNTFKAIVKSMNDYIKTRMIDKAAMEVFNTQKGTLEERVKDKNMLRKLNNPNIFNFDVSHLNKLIGKKPSSSFWGTVILDDDKNVTAAGLGVHGEIVVNYIYGTTHFDSLNEKAFITGLGQATYLDKNPFGITFGISSISFRTKEARANYWSYWENIRSQYVKKFKKLRGR